jgi:hypothetical protein
LEAARKQLELMDHGFRINLPGDDANLVPSTEEDLLIRIAELEGAISRHEERNAHRS